MTEDDNEDGSFFHVGPVPPQVVKRRQATRPMRAAGAIVGMAVGDALGAPYEFKPSQGITLAGTEADCTGGGAFGWARGEWTDDTSMAMPLLRQVAAGNDLRDEAAQDAVVGDWRAWAHTAPDVGVQTRRVLSQLTGEATAEAARAQALHVHQATGKSAGNGSLMRTAPVGIAYLGERDGGARTAQAARAVSDLTHFEQDAGDACVIWSVAIHDAALIGSLVMGSAIHALPEDRRERWRALIDEAQAGQPGDFARNGWVVHALQAAWSAIWNAAAEERGGAAYPGYVTLGPAGFRRALEFAINAGGDTDTVAAITGSLAGALAGIQAIPLGWQRHLHGWGAEGVVARAGDLTRLAALAARDGVPDSRGWMTGERVDYSGFGETGVLVRHPLDPEVWLGGVGALDRLPRAVDAVVSLCQVGAAQVPGAVAAQNRVEVWLLDEAEAWRNPHLDYVLAEAADAVARLRAEGRVVLLHCVQAQSRTPTVAALYAAKHLRVEVDEALAKVVDALPAASPNAAFRAALGRKGGA